MKVATIMGTRPEMIRLSQIIPKLDAWAQKHILVHTGQNIDPGLRDVFYEQLGIRQPDYFLEQTGCSLANQIGNIFGLVETMIHRETPDAVLVLGDTTSALSTLLCARLGVTVYHMEAGNRCYDPSVPEELNRRVIDAVSSFNLPYTRTSKENLLREGISPQRIWECGNPIFEVLQRYRPEIDTSESLDQLHVQAGQYLLVTAHRAENVDNESRLRNIVTALKAVAEHTRLPIICSVHPRTRDRLAHFQIDGGHPLIRYCPPFGLPDFVSLEQHAACVITDSGTVQEECCILGVPTVTIRTSTERPETVACGSNIVSGLVSQRIVEGILLMLQSNRQWTVPEGYTDRHVSDKIVQFILGGLCHV